MASFEQGGFSGTFRNDLRLESTVPVSGSGKLYVAEIAFEGFLAVTVSGVTRSATDIGVIKVKIQLGVKYAFEQSLVNLSNDALFAP